MRQTFALHGQCSWVSLLFGKPKIYFWRQHRKNQMNHQARTIIFTEKSSISFSASCSFPQTLWRQRLSSSSRLNEKRVSLYSSIRVLIEKDLFNLSAALPRDPFHSLANNRHQCCKWIYASTFTQHSDSLLSNSIFLFHNSSRCSAVITMTSLFCYG